MLASKIERKFIQFTLVSFHFVICSRNFFHLFRLFDCFSTLFLFAGHPFSVVTQKQTNKLWSKGIAKMEMGVRKVKERRKKNCWNENQFSHVHHHHHHQQQQQKQSRTENAHFRFRSTSIPFVTFFWKTSSPHSYDVRRGWKKRIELNTKQKQSAPNNHANTHTIKTVDHVKTP